MESAYVPGVCNIGPAEIARRRTFGWAGFAVTVIAFVLLVSTGADPWWRLALFIPAAAAASGFLQARLRFCSGFSRLGVFNFGEVGDTRPVADEDARAVDRRRGHQITLYAVLIGAAAAALAVMIG